MATVSIPLNQGKFALIDEEDYERVSQYKWRVERSRRLTVPDVFYAGRKKHVGGGKQTWIWLHRFLLNAPPGVLVDHKDGDGLNNTRANLRYATNSLNQANRRRKKPNSTSQYRGVVWNKVSRKWQARVSVKQKCHHLGTFDSEEAAAKAYDVAANAAFGEFAVLNFPEELEAA